MGHLLETEDVFKLRPRLQEEIFWCSPTNRHCTALALLLRVVDDGRCLVDIAADVKDDGLAYEGPLSYNEAYGAVAWRGDVDGDPRGVGGSKNCCAPQAEALFTLGYLLASAVVKLRRAHGSLEDGVFEDLSKPLVGGPHGFELDDDIVDANELPFAQLLVVKAGAASIKRITEAQV